MYVYQKHIPKHMDRMNNKNATPNNDDVRNV